VLATGNPDPPTNHRARDRLPARPDWRRQIDSGYRAGTGLRLPSPPPRARRPDSIAFTLDTPARAHRGGGAGDARAALTRELVRRCRHRRNGTTTRAWAARCCSCWCGGRSSPSSGGTRPHAAELDASTLGPSPGKLLEAGAGRRRRCRPAARAVRCRCCASCAPTTTAAVVHDASGRRRRARHRPACRWTAALTGRCPGAQAEAEGGGRSCSAAPAASAPSAWCAAGPARRQQRHQPRCCSGATALVPRRRPWRGGEKGGVVLSGGTFLGPREIDSMRQSCPSWCSFNCCPPSPVASAEQTLAADALNPVAFDRRRGRQADRDRRARCRRRRRVGVDDGPAAVFATTFYRELLAGQPSSTPSGTARGGGMERGPGQPRLGPPTNATADPNWSLAPRGQRCPDDGAAGGRGYYCRHRLGPGADAGSARGGGGETRRYGKADQRAAASKRTWPPSGGPRAAPDGAGGMGAVPRPMRWPSAETGDRETANPLGYEPGAAVQRCQRLVVKAP